jgi:hypothetical protein
VGLKDVVGHVRIHILRMERRRKKRSSPGCVGSEGGDSLSDSSLGLVDLVGWDSGEVAEIVAVAAFVVEQRQHGFDTCHQHCHDWSVEAPCIDAML